MKSKVCHNCKQTLPPGVNYGAYQDFSGKVFVSCSNETCVKALFKRFEKDGR